VELAAEQAGPAETADELCRASYRRLYAYVRSRASSDEDAADLTQQVYLQALRAWKRWPADPAARLPWLFRIARNAATDLHRRHRESVPWEALPDALHPTSGEQPDAGLLHREALDHLADVVAALPAAKRDLLALRFAAELSYAEIGAVIGKREDAVKKEMSRLLRSLKEQHPDNPYGSETAAPATSEILQQLFQHYGLQPDPKHVQPYRRCAGPNQ
jgi:RNA polymerase sigma-70 factor (ECF subfamily)